WIRLVRRSGSTSRPLLTGVSRDACPWTRTVAVAVEGDGCHDRRANGRAATVTEDRVQRLAEAVERLTQPHRTQVRQTLPSGDEHVATVAHAPLLKTLKDAIGGEVGRHATGKQAFEKTP